MNLIARLATHAISLYMKSGTNHLIFAYGLTDPDPDITYHETRRGVRTLPLRSYNDPPSEDKFIGLDTFEWRSDNVRIFLTPALDIDNSNLFLVSRSFK